MRPLSLLPLLVTPAILLRNARLPGHFLGQPFGEGWGRLFAIGQVERWLTGQATMGHADLLAWPQGMPFWPVDPLTTGLAAVSSLAAGSNAEALAGSLCFVAFLHLALVGVGAWLLARVAGARPWAATGAGLALQLHPFLVRSAQDGVVEVLALGPLALLVAAGFVAVKEGGRRAWLLALCAVLATALTSPYYAVYAFLVWALMTPLALWRWDRFSWMGVGGALVLGGVLAAAPLLHAEWGPTGRLDSRYEQGGYQLAPTERVILDLDGGVSHSARGSRGGARPESAKRPPRKGAPPGPPSAMSRLLHRFPGGLTCLLALMAGFLVKRARPWALAGLALFLLGAGPPLLARTIASGGNWPSPLQELLQLMPLTASLGNAQRLVVLYAIPAMVAGALAASHWRFLIPALALASVGEAWLVVPQLGLATTDIEVDARVLDAVDGPAVTFPLGDPPLWSPGAAPKRALFLAAVHEQPLAGDYGRGRQPADLPLLVTLSAWAELALDARAAGGSARRALPAPDPEGFTRLLVLHESLDENQRRALHERAHERWGAPLAESDWGAVYAIGE